MARNVEIKARVADAHAMRLRIDSLGAGGPEEVLQIDTFFHVAAGRLKLREFGNGTGELIAYDRPDEIGPKVSTYLRISSPDPLSLREVLIRALGLRATVRKRRLVFLLGQTLIHLDEVEGLGSFVELEVVLRDGQDADDGEQITERLLEHLSIARDDLLSHAYVDLMEGIEATGGR
jgi:predicted adenylyl cyclase CyaB